MPHKVPQSGLYKLHKGEVIVPAYKVKIVDKVLKDAGKNKLKKQCNNCFVSSKNLSKRKTSHKKSQKRKKSVKINQKKTTINYF